MNIFKNKSFFKIKEVSHGATLVILMWSMIIITSLSWNIYQAYQQAYQRAESTALSNFNRDQAFRFWVSQHNGIHIKDTDTGTYTFYDPASFLREVMSSYPENFDSSVRMVGYKPFNQNNIPNAWEYNMLDAFAGGAIKYLEYETSEKHHRLGYFEPMFAQSSCLSCHIAHEYKVGELMGAAGVYINLNPFMASAKKIINFLLITHIIIWCIGYIATVLYGRKTEIRIKEHLQLENKLSKSYEQLEQRVEARTLELSKLSKAVENSPAMVLIADGQGTVEYVNQRFTEITGYNTNDILGQKPSIMKSSRTPDATYKKLWKTVLTGNLWSGELCNVRKDGTEFWVSASISPIMDDSGQVVNFIAVEEDITEKKFIEEALISAKDSAVQANRAKSEFLASMSHELRTPLNAIIGFSQLSEFDSSLNKQQKNNSKQIYKAGKHLLNLVDDVLDLTKIEIGKIKLNIQSIVLTDLMDECYELVNPLANEKQIELNLLKNQCECFVKADYTRLKQILLNLLSNAIKYTAESGHVEVTCQSNENNIQVSISDNGSGISKENQEKLFEPFNRLGKEGGNIQGTGIGLVITKKLIDMMGGNLELESDINRGSTFTLILPKEDQNNISIVDKNKKEIEFRDKSSDNLSLKIVYIEDNLTNTRLMQNIINLQENWTLLTAITAEEGIQVSQVIKPDIILMDINLPKMSGIEAFHHIKTIGSLKNIPVIAVSAGAMQENIEQAMDAGFTDYITKPIDIKTTIRTINKAIRYN